jgi:hypothetical protein
MFQKPLAPDSRLLSAAAALASLLGAAGIAIAGPPEGDMFGYRLGERYPVGESQCPPIEATIQESLRILCGGSFELAVLRVRRMPPIVKKHTVQVSLRFDEHGRSSTGRRVDAQYHEEMKQLEREGRKPRLIDALKEQRLRDMQ